jgi:hypothetical protein
LRAAEVLSTALLSPDAIQIPALLRSHYISSLLDWLLSAVGRSGGGATTRGIKRKKGSEKSSDASTKTDQAIASLWKLLATVLDNSLISPERPLPASLLTNITAAVHQASSLYEQPSQRQLCNALKKLINLLGTKFSASFKPALEPTAALVEAALADQIQDVLHSSGVGAAAVDLLVPLLKQQPNPRKSWDAVVPRLFSLLLNAGFGNLPTSEQPESSSENEKKEEDEKLKAGCREALACVLFSQAHVASIADATNIALIPPKVEKPSAEEAVAAMFAPKPSRLYTLQFFNQLEKMIEAATAVRSAEENESKIEEPSANSGVFYALPWLVEQYCIAVNRYKRAAEIAAAIASQAGLRLPTGGAGNAAGENSGTNEKETRSIGGVSVDADFKFFTAITSILQKKLNSIGEAIKMTEINDDSYLCYRAVQKSLLLTLGSMCSTLKPSHIYRPTEDPEGNHRQWLADLVTTAIRFSTPNSDDYPYHDEPSPGSTTNTTASLKVLEAVLTVEHRGVQPHLPILWPMVWCTMPVSHPHNTLNYTSSYTASEEREALLEKERAHEESSFIIQVSVATALINAYGELRQLEVLLSSLVHAVRALTTSCSAAAKLVTSPTFSKVLKTALGGVPSGQVAALVRMVTSWIPALELNTAESAKLPAAVLLIADLGSACLAALHVDVITAPAVADALSSLIRGLSPVLSSRIGTSPEGRVIGLFDSRTAAAAAGTYESIAGALELYRHALKLHSLCCLLHPEVVPLPGQELYIVNADKVPSGGYFDAVLNHNDDSESTAARPMVVDFSDEGAPSGFNDEPVDADIWKLANNNVPSYFRAAIGIAAAQRIETLQYRRMHAQHSCDPGSNGNEDVHATTTTVSLVEKEIAFLGKLLLKNLHSSRIPGSPPQVLVLLENFSLSKFSASRSHIHNYGMGLWSALILQNQVVLDALLESPSCSDESSLFKLVFLLLRRFQAAEEYEESENEIEVQIDDVGRNAMQHALSHAVLAAVAPLEIAKELLELVKYVPLLLLLLSHIIHGIGILFIIILTTISFPFHYHAVLLLLPLNSWLQCQRRNSKRKRRRPYLMRKALQRFQWNMRRVR